MVYILPWTYRLNPITAKWIRNMIRTTNLTIAFKVPKHIFEHKFFLLCTFPAFSPSTLFSSGVFFIRDLSLKSNKRRIIAGTNIWLKPMDKRVIGGNLGTIKRLFWILNWYSKIFKRNKHLFRNNSIVTDYSNKSVWKKVNL